MGANGEAGCCEAGDAGRPCKCLPIAVYETANSGVADAIGTHAANGLLSYRCKSHFGRILIGARDDADAWNEARRSTDQPHDMEVLVGGRWKAVRK